MSTEIPRRAYVNKWTPAEKAIADAVDAVEAAGADVRLTDAVTLLYEARQAVADFVDGVDKRRAVVFPAPSGAAPAETPMETSGKTLEQLVYELQAHARESGWEDCDEPLVAVLLWEPPDSDSASAPPTEREVGCETSDGLIKIHKESEVCEVCQPSVAPPERETALREKLNAATTQLVGYIQHLDGCEIGMTEFCTCGRRAAMDAYDSALKQLLAELVPISAPSGAAPAETTSCTIAGCYTCGQHSAPPPERETAFRALVEQFKALMTHEVVADYRDHIRCHWCLSSDLYGPVVHRKDCAGVAFLSALLAASPETGSPDLRASKAIAAGSLAWANARRLSHGPDVVVNREESEAISAMFLSLLGAQATAAEKKEQ